jgi:RNA polymerase sigma-70 factor (ECF subfamily)
MNILHSKEDVDEIVNDTCLQLWNSIPPQLPKSFSTYIGRVVRNLAIKKYKMQNAKKRGGNETTLLLSELENCIPCVRNIEDEIDSNDLAQTIDRFLATIKQTDRLFFVCRYWHYYSVPEITRRFDVSEGKVTMSLYRTRKKLKKYLEQRGITL